MLPALSMVLLSFFTGILIGLTSIGGAALVTPFLILVAGMRPDLAVGTDLVYSMFTKLLAAWLYWKQGVVDLRLVRTLALASLPASAIGTLLMMKLHNGVTGDGRVKTAVGASLVIVAVVSLIPYRKPRTEGSSSMRMAFTVAYAASAGFFVGLTSIGSGTLILPFLLAINRLPPIQAIGTDIFHAAVLTGVTALLHARYGAVQWDTVFWLVLGSAPGIVIGSRLALRLPEKPLRAAILSILLFSAYKLIR